MTRQIFTCGMVVAALLPLVALAAVTVEEAARLRTTLTPMGAERAGNKEGSIPAWDGGVTKAPADYQSGSPRPDPFPADKPVLSISAKNMDAHAARLSDGVKALMKKYPDFRIDVYPTRRTAAAPQYVYDNTFRNATHARLVDNGQGVEGAFGGIPFPIAKDAYEVILNHRLAWRGVNVQLPTRQWLVMADGRRTLASGGVQTWRRPYYDPEITPDKFDGYYMMGKFLTTEPGSKAGEAIVGQDGINAAAPRGVWQYLVGQRRVRKAPAVGYDTPDAVTSGAGLFDEAFLLLGPLDKHKLKLLGKKELYVPYNNNRAALAKVPELVTPNTLNPALVRWELHRVWEVEATLIPGKRHVVPRRRYYVDEDSWQIILIDGWDATGDLWRTNFTLTLLAPDMPALMGNVMWGCYDLQSGVYYLNDMFNDLRQQPRVLPTLSRGFFSPDELVNESLR